MKRWAILDKAEFEARQGCFEFGEACRFVINATVELKKRLGAMFVTWKKGFRTVDPVRKCRQLVLELDSIAQMPLPGVPA